MSDKFKNEIKSSTTSVLIPTAVTALTIMYPPLAVPIAFAGGFLGLAISSSKNKAEEFLKFISDNKNIVSDELFRTDKYKLFFTLSFEKYLKERSEYRKEYIKNIYLSGILENCDEDFELERYFFTISLLGKKEYKILFEYELFISNQDNDWDYLTGLKPIDSMNSEDYSEALSVLSSVGLVNAIPLFNGTGYKLNNFGYKFRDYIKSN